MTNKACSASLGGASTCVERSHATAPCASHVVLIARQVILFVTDFEQPPHHLEAQLAATLTRLAVSTRSQRVVALAEHPRLGSQHQVRVTPCLLLDLGTRQVLLLGDPGQLDAQGLEAALLQR